MPRSRRLAVSLLAVGAVTVSAWVTSTASADTVKLPTHTSAERAFSTGADMAENGTAVFAWWNFDTDSIHALTRVPGGSWTEMPIGAAKSASSVDVVENNKGVFTVVWQGPSGLRTRQWSAGGGWKAIEQIATGTNLTDPDVDAAPNGNVTVLWRKGSSTLLTRTKTNAGWQPVRSLGTSRLAVYPSLVTDGAGRQTAVWTEWRRDPASGEDPDSVPRVPRMATRGTPTQAWGTKTWLEGTEYDTLEPHIAVGGGVVAIAYVTDRAGDTDAAELVARRFLPGGASSRAVIEESANLTWGGDLTADSLGQLYLVYTRADGTGDDDLRSSYYAGGSWSGPVTRVSLGDVVKPEVEWRQAGFSPQLAVMWTDYDDGRKAKYALAPGAGAWSAPAVLGTGGDSAQNARGFLFDDETNFVGYVVANSRLDVVPFDRGAPTTRITDPPGGFTLGASASFTWSAVDRWSPIEHYNTFVTRRTPFAPETVVGTGLSGTPLTAQNVSLPDHTTTCLQAQAKDTVQPGPGAYSAARCLTTPLDDTLIDWPTGWTMVDQSGSYRGTVHRSKQQGKSFTMNDVRLRTWALLVTKAPGNGTVEVFFDGVKKATRSLAATTVRKKVIVPLPAFASERQGDVRVRIKTSGKWVQVDGIFLGR